MPDGLARDGVDICEHAVHVLLVEVVDQSDELCQSFDVVLLRCLQSTDEFRLRVGEDLLSDFRIDPPQSM